MKHRFFDLTHVAIWESQDAENDFKVTSLSGLQPRRNLGYSGGRK